MRDSASSVLATQTSSFRVILVAADVRRRASSLSYATAGRVISVAVVLHGTVASDPTDVAHDSVDAGLARGAAWRAA